MKISVVVIEAILVLEPLPWTLFIYRTETKYHPSTTVAMRATGQSIQVSLSKDLEMLIMPTLSPQGNGLGIGRHLHCRRDLEKSGQIFVWRCRGRKSVPPGSFDKGYHA